MQIFDKLLLSLIAFAAGSASVRAVAGDEFDWVRDAGAASRQQVISLAQTYQEL
jgi:hypothetical protein